MIEDKSPQATDKIRMNTNNQEWCTTKIMTLETEQSELYANCLNCFGQWFSCICCAGCCGALHVIPVNVDGLVEEYGKFLEILPPGMHTVNPLTKRVFQVDKKAKTISYTLTPTPLLTKDGVKFL